MDYFLKAVALVVVIASAIAINLLRRTRKSRLPPGSLGVPVIGQTLGFLRALRGNNGDGWIRDRIHRYGPVSKLSLFCTPTVVLAGPAANKFVFFSSMLRMRQIESVNRMVGKKSIVDLYGEDHRRVRGALMEFLKPDMLKLYIGRIDIQVRQHLEENWYGRTTVKVLPLMKLLTFDVISGLLFGLEKGPVRAALADDLVRILEGALAIPVNLPFTAFSRGLKASRRVRRLLEAITGDKKAKLQGQGQASASPPNNNDLITRLLSLTGDHREQLLTDEEIVDNCIVALVAGHDPTSILLTFMVRHLANDPATLRAMVQEHEEIARNKADGEALTCDDLSRMKFTWQVAQETLRVVPPVFGGFRTALEDIEFEGYCIPKGWQVFWMASVTHMDPSIFHEPAKFQPSRFDSKSPATPPCSFAAFGGGPRICPGMEFAKIETLVVMHHLVRLFRWKLCCKENTFVLNPFPSPLHGLPIELEHKRSL
ncbi:unnamed protein product [Alopecurus aequalis]